MQSSEVPPEAERRRSVLSGWFKDMTRGRDHSPDEVRSDYRTSHLHKGDSYDALLCSDAWTAYLAQQEQRIVTTVIRKYFCGRPVRCMDFACGTGRLTATLEDLAENCLGIDVSPDMIAQAARKCKKSSFHVSDLTKETPDLGSFDLITAFRFFGNAQDTLRGEALSALYRHLHCSGYVVLNNHRNPLALQNLFYHWTGGKSNMDLTLAGLARHAETLGFEIVDIYGIGCWSLRHRWQSWVEKPPKRVRVLEQITRFRILAAFAPDWIVVLRKRHMRRGAWWKPAHRR